MMDIINSKMVVPWEFIKQVKLVILISIFFVHKHCSFYFVEKKNNYFNLFCTVVFQQFNNF